MEGSEKLFGKAHPDTINSVRNIVGVYTEGLKDYGKAEQYYERLLEGYEAQLEKDHGDTKRCVRNFMIYLGASGNSTGLAQLKKSYSNAENYF